MIQETRYYCYKRTTRLLIVVTVPVPDVTACIKGFFDAEKDIKKVIKSTNYISKFCALKSLMKFKLF